tara:strand:+ start:236 stop:739 length:504 start_codon:yes stop_codon:yes gene_type:complete
MQQKVLSKQALYYGDVSMPKNWDIDKEKLLEHILQSQLFNKEFPFSKTWDMLNTYIQEHIYLNYEIQLINKKTWGNSYKAKETTVPFLQADPLDLRNSPDYTLLYGVEVKDCNVTILYDDNRRKNKSWNIELKNNMFIMFPSTCMYYLINNQKDSVNFVQTITYEYP